MVEIKKGEFREDVPVEERFIGETAKKKTKIAKDTTFTDVTEGEIPITKAESIARENVEAMGKVFQPVKDYVVNPIYKAWDLGGRALVDKLNPLDDDFLKQHLLKNGVAESVKSQVFLEIKSGEAICIIKTSYFEFSNQLENVKLAMEDYEYKIKII